MRTLIVGCFILCCGCGQSPRDIKSITLEPVASRLGSPRNPFLVEVGKDSIVLLPNDTCYFDLFSDDNQRDIRVGDIAESNDLNRLLNYVLKHQGSSGDLRSRRDTIITFLIRPEGVETYREAKQVVDKFEKENEKRLVISVLPNGAPVVDSLSGKTPFVPKLEGEEYEIRPPTPKDVPRRPNGTPLLARQDVLVSNGKIIPFIYSDGVRERSLKPIIKMIIDKNHIDVEDGHYITDPKQALKVIDECNKEQIGNKHFKVECVKQGNSIVFELLPTDDCGEEPDKAIKGFFATVLRNRQIKYYLRYLVEPDSFEAYAEIRKVTDSNGFYAGWTIVEPGSYTHRFYSGYNIGEKPQPGRPDTVKGVLD